MSLNDIGKEDIPENENDDGGRREAGWREEVREGGRKLEWRGGREGGKGGRELEWRRGREGGWREGMREGGRELEWRERGREGEWRGGREGWRKGEREGGWREGWREGRREEGWQSDESVEREEHIPNEHTNWRRGVAVGERHCMNQNSGGWGKGNYPDRNELSYRQLAELQNKDLSTIVIALDSGLGPLLNKTTINSDTMYLVARVLAESCSCTSAPVNLVQVLITVVQSSFHDHVIKTLQEANLQPRENESEKRQFIKDVLTFMKTLAMRLPSSYMNTKMLGLENYLDMVIKQLELSGVGIIDEELLEKKRELQDIKTTIVDKVATLKQEREIAPPCDFRNMSIFPNVEDIYPDEKTFLRKNIGVGGYENLEHYLDVQFRLLREDFVSPLRDGIAVYLEAQVTHQGDEKLKDIRVYHDVHVIRTVCSKGGLLHRLKFDVSRLRRVQWENSKRLIYGSLVCLSHDNFQTLLFATVSDSDPKNLKDGMIDVLFENDDDMEDIITMYTQFVMVETSAYFEAYRHVLKALQTLHDGDLPFEKYIVSCTNEVEATRYLRENTTPIYDLRPLVDEGIVLRQERESCAKEVQVLDQHDWPSAEQLQLDSSQYRAVKTALTKEFVIIQGPPGTGKTYVGLKIVKALLHNSEMWSDGDTSPMLIVCYTNHALDQFLEGVVSYFKGGVIRVGGRSKSKILERFSMKAQKRKYSDTMSDISEEMDNLKFLIEGIDQQIERAKREILNEHTLKNVMGEHYDFMLMQVDAMLMTMQANGYEDVRRPSSVMDEWLKCGSIENMMFTLEQVEDMRYEQDERVPGERRVIFQLPKIDRKHLNRRLLNQISSVQKMPADEANRVGDPWDLQINDRWRLYRYWVYNFIERLGVNIREIKEEYQETVKMYKEEKMIEDKKIMKMATVIGMTTTAAARYQQVLAEIGSKIIVVEEAAEVLEGHIITTLSKGCQHLILIGDHKQLKPNPTVYKLAKQFNLDLSLFERMVNNGVHCDTLELQHRMRPDISRLMKPIYPTLQDHPSVLNFEQIKGVSGNIFFVNHGCPEESDNEMHSHSNQFEAKYVVALCGYLLKQCYQQSQITVLTTYSGQLFKLKKLMPNDTKFEGVKVTVVDNYQGEENDIILLSLVRSNPEGKAGFLKIENRVCVALSRARYGLFVIGNFDMLTQESQLWKEIVKDLKINNMIGTSLKLYCQNHPNDDGFTATDPSDFMKAPEGGCMKQCSFRLNCGHVCNLRCHPYDPQHEEYTCSKPCLKTISCKDHPLPCPRMCYQDCEKCQVPVEKILHLCGHTQMVPCTMETSEFSCKDECEKILICGHRCGNPCGKEHKCTQMVTKTWRCGHDAEIQCTSKDSAQCMTKCTEVLKCGHTCRGNCHDCHEGRLHVACRMNCKRILLCGHECEDICSYCPPCSKQCRNRCPHSKCYSMCGEICIPCKEPCQWECAHYKCTKICCEPCNRPACDEPCTKRLPCRHPCIGLCGEPCPRLCRICNKDEVTTIIFGTEDEPDARFVELEDCAHVIEVSALDRYMDMKNDDDIIQLKGCPRCKAEIRQNVRYGFMIKKRLEDIETVKRINNSRIRELKSQLENEVKTEKDADERKEKTELLRRGFCRTESGLTVIENQFRFLKSGSKLLAAYEMVGNEWRTTRLRSSMDAIMSSMKDFEIFQEWMEIPRLSIAVQEESDAQKEWLRHKAVVRLLHLKTISTTRQLELEADITTEMSTLEGMLTDGKPYTEDRRARAKEIFQRLKEHIPESDLGISEDEEVEILKAMDLSKGHWFKCPNGHVYAISDCRDVTLEGKCPECKPE